MSISTHAGGGHLGMRSLLATIVLFALPSTTSCFTDDGTGSFGRSHVVVTGMIVDARSGTPVSGTLIEIILREEDCSRPPWTSAFVFTTSDQGAFAGKLVITGSFGFQRGCITFRAIPSPGSGLQVGQG